MKKSITALLLALASCIPMVAQEVPAPAPKTAPAHDIFSGIVTELTSDSIVVVRKVSGKEAVTRRFALDLQTKVEGVLKLKARVTVRFQAGAEEPVPALHIIVR